MGSGAGRKYIAVSRGRSAAMFREGETWAVRAVPAGPTPVDIVFSTAYVSIGSEAKAPRWLFAEVSGAADSIDDAIGRFPNAVRALTPLFDVAMNAGVEELDLHLAFDATPGREERDFFQNFLPEDPPTLPSVRPVNSRLLSHLTDAVARHPDHVRIHRAAAHYQQALRFSSLGDETRAVGQLWRGFEALTPVARRREMARTQAGSTKQLAEALNVDVRALDGTVRVSVLFAGDVRSCTDTKSVSDAFEHGYKPLDELRALARGTRDAAAVHLRSAIIRQSGVDDAIASEMLSAPYDTPVIGSPIAKYLRGTLRGSGELADPTCLYPSVTWRSEIKRFYLRQNGQHHVDWIENITPVLGPAMQLRDVSIELWSGDKAPGVVKMQRTAGSRRSMVPSLPAIPQLPRQAHEWAASFRERCRRVIRLTRGRSR